MIKNTIKFIKSNWGLNIGAAIASSIFISYEMTMDLPEIIPHGNFFYNLASQLSLSFLGCFVFYIMQVYIPEEKNKNKIKKSIKPNIYRTMNRMIKPIESMCKFNLEKYDINNLKSQDFCNVEDKGLILNRKFNHEGEEMMYIQYLAKSAEDANKFIDEIYTPFSAYLELELIELLDKIKYSAYHNFIIATNKRIQMTEKIKDRNIQNAKDTKFEIDKSVYDKNFIEEYYGYYKELEEYYDKI